MMPTSLSLRILPLCSALVLTLWLANPANATESDRSEQHQSPAIAQPAPDKHDSNPAAPITQQVNKPQPAAQDTDATYVPDVDNRLTPTAPSQSANLQPAAPHPAVADICQQIGKKLSSISVDDCLAANFLTPRFFSNRNLPLLEKHFDAAADAIHPPRILFLGGIHGDEYSSVSISFKWLATLQQHHSGIFDWHFLPLTNPDGLLQDKSTRVNANRVDLNRNFIPAETAIDPLKHWQTHARKRARYYPGTAPLSEPESQAIHQLIEEIKPDVIVSVHAPHGILDFDGTIQPPQKLGPLHLKQLGTYPGSLGNYGWFVKQIPVMTIELKHAGIMPQQKDIERMWVDLIHWIKLRTDGDGTLLARKTSRTDESAAKPAL